MPVWLRRSVVVLALVSMVVVGALPAGAGTRAAGRPVVIAIHAGDQIAVGGTHIRCAVSASLPVTIICGVGDKGSPFAGSYGFAVADQAALFLRASATRQPLLVLRKTQPKLNIPVFPAASGKPRSLSVKVGTVLTIARTHVFCAVTTTQGMTTITCGLTAIHSGLLIPGTYAGVVTSRYALLARQQAGDRVQTLIQRKQP
jgi:hypothetical protein